MGFWKAKEVNVKELGPFFLDLLAEKEDALNAFKFRRDYFVFTSRRLILVDRQGVTGRKTEYHSIPYRGIAHYAVQTAGNLDRDAELKIWVIGIEKPIERDLSRSVDTRPLLRMLAEFVV